MLDDILKERLKKKEELEKLGHNVYPSYVKRTHFISDVLNSFPSLAKKKSKVFIAGRVMGMRIQGSIGFIDIEDTTGKTQALLKKNNLKDFPALKGGLDIGDFVEISGPLFKTKQGEKTIEAKTAKIIVKTLRPLPSVWHGLKDVEERFRKRYLDLLLNKDAKSHLTKRSEIVNHLRSSLNEECFLEVETPMLQPIAGGAKARPFKTHHNAMDMDLYLRVAPELYLKRLLVGGMERVFEIGRNFRNEGVDRDHNPEFTMLEMYWAYQDYKGLMKFAEKMLKKYLPGKWQTITFSELYKKHTGRDWRKEDPAKLDDIYKHEIRAKGKVKETTWVLDYPESIMPLAKHKADDPTLTESFQLIAGSKLGGVAQAGAEIVKGFSELNNPVAQRKQMEGQERAFRKGDQEASRLDEDFLEALEHGMPPAAGLGLGIDRLAAIVTKSHSVKEIIAFPTLKPRE